MNSHELKEHIIICAEWQFSLRLKTQQMVNAFEMGNKYNISRFFLKLRKHNIKTQPTRQSLSLVYRLQSFCITVQFYCISRDCVIIGYY